MKNPTEMMGFVSNLGRAPRARPFFGAEEPRAALAGRDRVSTALSMRKVAGDGCGLA
jgi:hypothetical protein